MHLDPNKHTIFICNELLESSKLKKIAERHTLDVRHRKRQTCKEVYTREKERGQLHPVDAFLLCLQGIHRKPCCALLPYACLCLRRTI